jgi:hypothetical protein
MKDLASPVILNELLFDDKLKIGLVWFSEMVIDHLL